MSVSKLLQALVFLASIMSVGLGCSRIHLETKSVPVISDAITPSYKHSRLFDFIVAPKDRTVDLQRAKELSNALSPSVKNHVEPLMDSARVYAYWYHDKSIANKDRNMLLRDSTMLCLDLIRAHEDLEVIGAVYVLLGYNLWLLKKNDWAFRVLHQLIVTNKNMAYFDLGFGLIGEFLFERGDYLTAARFYTGSLWEISSRDEGLGVYLEYKLAWSYIYGGNVDRGVSLLKKVTSRSPVDYLDRELILSAKSDVTRILQFNGLGNTVP